MAPLSGPINDPALVSSLSPPPRLGFRASRWARSSSRAPPATLCRRSRRNSSSSSSSSNRVTTRRSCRRSARRPAGRRRARRCAPPGPTCRPPNRAPPVSARLARFCGVALQPRGGVAECDRLSCVTTVVFVNVCSCRWSLFSYDSRSTSFVFFSLHGYFTMAFVVSRNSVIVWEGGGGRGGGVPLRPTEPVWVACCFHLCCQSRALRCVAELANLPSRPRPLLRVDPVYGGWHINSELCVESPALCRTTQECLGYKNRRASLF